MGLLDDAKRYWVDEPQDVGYDAYMRAGEAYGKSGEWTKADAAKHMAWQAELAKRTMLPGLLAVPVANTVGLVKEVAVDGLGSTYNYLKGTGENPTGTWLNSVMDVANNYVGASRLRDSADVTGDAVRLAGKSSMSIGDPFRNRLPYADK